MDIEQSSKLNLLLRGRIVVLEIDSGRAADRTWVEITLNREAEPAYPLRIPAQAMLGGSKFQTACPPESASFKLRKASFARSDIENGFDPNYDRVGTYVDLSSIAALRELLASEGLDIEAFVDSATTDYPL